MSDYPTLREESLNQAYANGHRNAFDILKDSFGGEIPAELDLVNPPSYDVRFLSIFKNPKFYVSTIWETIKSQWIWTGINLFFHAPITAAVTFAVSAVAQGLALKGFVDPQVPDVITINDAWALPARFNKASGGLADVVAHESAHLLQANDARISLSSAFNEDRSTLSTLSKNRSKFVKYLSSDAEMQARLFTVITNAYIQHKHMPTNKYELWATLASQGMTPPDDVLEIARRHPQGKQAFAKFPLAQAYVDYYADKNGVKDLGRVQDSIESQSGKFELWNEVYPFLYGDMLEIMGDRLGQKRMGGSHNVQLREIFMRAAQDNMAGKLSNADTMVQMKKVTSMMPADDALSLMKHIASGRAYKEYNADPIVIPSGYLRAVSAFTLANHPDLQPHVTARALAQATGMTPIEWKRRMEGITRAPGQRDATPPRKTGPWGLRVAENRWNPIRSLSAA